MLQTKTGLFFLRSLFLALGFAMFLLVEAAAQGALPFWLVLCVLPICFCVLAQLFFLSIRAPRQKKRHTRRPASAHSMRSTQVAPLANQNPTAC